MHHLCFLLPLTMLFKMKNECHNIFKYITFYDFIVGMLGGAEWCRRGLLRLM